MQAFNTVTGAHPGGRTDQTRSPSRKGNRSSKAICWLEIDPRPYQAALDQAQGQEGPGRGQPGQRQSGSTALYQARRVRDPPADRHPALDGGPVDRADSQADDAADFENAQTQVDYTGVKAPISGIAGLRQVDVGNIVNASTQTGIVTIAQIEPITVIFTAPEDQLPYINEAQSAPAL